MSTLILSSAKETFARIQEAEVIGRPNPEIWGSNPYTCTLIATGSLRKLVMAGSVNAGVSLPGSDDGPLDVQDWWRNSIVNSNGAFDRQQYWKTGDYQTHYPVQVGLEGSPLIGLASVEGMPFFGHQTGGEGPENDNPGVQAERKAEYLKHWLMNPEASRSSMFGSFPSLIVATDAIDAHMIEGKAMYLGKPAYEEDFPAELNDASKPELLAEFSEYYLAKHFPVGRVINHTTGLSFIDTENDQQLTVELVARMEVDQDIFGHEIAVDPHAGGGAVIQQLLMHGLLKSRYLTLNDGEVLKDPMEILYHISGMPIRSIVSRDQQLSRNRG